MNAAPDVTILAREALELTQEIIDECGPRLAGTEACKRAAEVLAERLRPHCDAAVLEPFDVHPDAFLGFMRVTGIWYLAGTALALASITLLAAITFTVGAIFVLVEFLLYREVLDPWFPRRIAHNVVATIEPTGEAARQIVFAGHHDSARVFNMLCYWPRLYRIRLIGAFAAIIGSPLIMGLAFALGSARLSLAGAAFSCVMGLAFVAPMWFFLGKEGTPGAGDNLIASSMLVSIARALAQDGNALESTRVILLSSDAEESGLRGARAFVRRHRDELRALPTMLLNADSVYRADLIQFLRSDLNGFVALDHLLATRCVEIAQRLGIRSRVFRMYPGAGATDAAEFAKVGVKATTLLAMPTDIETSDLAYHTPRDTVSAIEPRAVEACLGIALELARELDSAAGDPLRTTRRASSS